MPRDDDPIDPPGRGGPAADEDAGLSEAETAAYAYVADEVGPAGDTRGDTRPGGRIGEDDDHFLELLAPGRLVDQYKILRFLGRGGMSEVYLARDVGLGRKVAIKVLLPRALGSEEAVERFLFEARATARFSFPHIVTIHAVGEFRGYPYLALEYLEGQSLQQRLREAPPSTREAMRFGLAIAEALQEAHRHQILHRDLKPANVMIPKDGRLRVVDFGLAKRAPLSDVDLGGLEPVGASTSASEGMQLDDAFQSLANAVRGTPAYMSPEQWAGEPVTGATDVWGLGLVLYEMVEGTHPLLRLSPTDILARLFHGTALPPPERDLPPQLADLIARCVDKAPGRRPAIGEVVETLRGLLHGRREPGTLASPFRGLLPLDERHADQFHGRDAELAAFVERMRWEPVLPVIGPSGSGKSSFVQAGVIPRLQEQGRWRVLRLRPGPRPFLALATRLRTRGSSQWGTATGGPSGASRDGEGDADAAERALRDQLVASPASLAVQLGEIGDEERARVLLFVDQLEELATLTEDPRERRAFMEAICLAADDPEGPVRVVFTLREDFLGRLALGPASRAALGKATVMVTPGPDGLREIVERTVHDAGYRFDDPDLPARIVAEVAEEAAALPMIQFAGQTLWRRRDDVKLRLLRSVYEEVGGVAGCMAHHADGLLDALTPAQVRSARALLLRLVTTEGTRRVVPRDRLLDGLPADAAEVLDRLVQGRIVHVRKSGAGEDDAVLELVHESLIRSWGALTRWIDESREELAFLDQVEQAVDLWEARGERVEEVWRGEALAEAQAQVQRMAAGAPPRVQRFLAAGEARQRAEAARARTRWAAVVGLVALVGITAAVLATVLTDPAARCSHAEQRLAGVWDDGARADLRDAFLAVDRPYAADTHAKLEPILDDYASGWVAAHTEACEATHVRGEQSERVLDLRMACLERRRASFAALVELLTTEVDGPLLDRSISAAYDLAPLHPCADAEALSAAVPPPEDPRVADRVEELRGELDRAAALEKTGRYQAGIDLAGPATERADAIDYPPIQAEAWYQLGALRERQGEYERAEADLLRAAEAAARAHDDRLLARIWIDLILVIGDRLARPEEGRVYQRLADVTLTRAGDDPLLEAQMLHNLGNVLLVQGDYAGAEERYTASMQIRIEELGEDHPDVAASLNNLGLAVGNMGEYERSRELQQRALEIKRRALGPDHPDVAASLNNLGIVLTYEKRYEEAIAAYEEAYRILEAAFGPGHGDVAMLHNNLGHIHEVRKDYDTALEHHQRALELRREHLGERHPDVATSLFNVGVVHGDTGRWQEALQLYDEALSIYAEAYGEDHPAAAYPLTAAGNCHLALGDPAAAVAPLREAQRLRVTAGTDPVMLADTRFALARALWSSGVDRAGAVAAAGQARADLAGQEELHPETVARVEAWLAGER